MWFTHGESNSGPTECESGIIQPCKCATYNNIQFLKYYTPQR